MLIIHVSQIPPEGLPVDVDLAAGRGPHRGRGELRPQSRHPPRSLVERGEENSVHVRGRLTARLGLECGRCLEPFDFRVDQDLDLFYLPRRPEGVPAGEEEDDDVELERPRHGRRVRPRGPIDLGEMVREQFFLALPMGRPVPRGVPGLCPTCGMNGTGLLRCRARRDRSPAGPA